MERTPIIKFGYLTGISQNAELFVKYMKASGFVITLKASEHQPDDDIITNPQWLINHFRKIVKPPSEGRTHKAETANWKMTKEELKTKFGNATSDKTKETLILFMEHVGLLAKSYMKLEEYFIPSQMEKMVEEDFEHCFDSHEANVSKALTLNFRKRGTRQIPFPHFDKLMKELISNPPVGYFNEDEITRNSCILLKGEPPIRYFLSHGSSIVKITVFTQSKTDGIKQNEALKIMHRIIHTSKQIGKRFNQYLVEKPIIGMSCNPFPPKHKKFYRTILEVIDNKTDCCKGKCKLVQRNDLEVFQGK